MQSPEFTTIAPAATGLAICLLLVGCASAPIASSEATTARGQPINEADLVAWNIDVRTPDGLGLPAGSGTVSQGKAVFDEQCASCHGAAAAGGPVFGSMVGGIGSFMTDRRVLTPGSMYPYAPILFDYVRRSMPMNAPQSLSNDQAYAVTGYMLHLNGLVGPDAVMTAGSLSAVQMPNRNGFIVDDRPDTNAVRCMTDCRPIAGK